MLERAHGLGIPGVVHGFTTRSGGVSRGGFATLNLGRRWGDDPDHVEENHARVARAGGFAAGELCLVRQVHGSAVLRAREVRDESEADALWIRRGDEGPTVIGVLTADCVPVLLVDDAGTVAAAVHSGWRGTRAGVVPRAVEALADAGAEPGRLRAAIGPCIEREAFEVGPEVAAEFPEEHVHVAGYARPHVDLVGVVRDQLRAAGLAADRIERVGGCTHRDAGRYFSYRRDGAGIGQHLSFIGFA